MKRQQAELQAHLERTIAAVSALLAHAICEADIELSSLGRSFDPERSQKRRTNRRVERGNDAIGEVIYRWVESRSSDSTGKAKGIGDAANAPLRSAANVHASPAFYRLSDVMRICALSRSTIYRRIAEGTFPAPVRLGRKASGWSSECLQAWIENPAGYRVTPRS